MPTIHRSRVTLFRSRESGQPSTALERWPVAVYSSVKPHTPPAEETKQLAKPSLAVSLPVSCRGIRTLAGRIDRVRSLDVNVHLLSHIKRSVLVLHPINDFENTRVHALCAVARQRFFGDHIRFKANELQGNSYRTVATRRRGRQCSAAHTPGIVLIHIHTDVQRSDTSENHETLTERTALRKLAQPHFVLQNDARNRRAHGETINIGCSHLDLSFRLRDFRFRDSNIGSPCARL